MSDEPEAYLNELIDQLMESDRYVDLDLLAEIMAQGDAVVDTLIDIMETDEGWPSVHAMMMLIEMRAEKALPAISRLLREDPDLNGWVDTDGLDKFGPAAIETLEAMVRDKDANWYPRAIAAGALMRIAARYPETYDRITAFLRSFLPNPDALALEDEDEDPDIWNSIVADLCHLRDPQAHDLIERMFDAHIIDPTWMSRQDCEEAYAATDPLYGVDPEPRDLFSHYRWMQAAWRRLEKEETTPPSRHGRWERWKRNWKKRKSQRAARKRQRAARKQQRAARKRQRSRRRKKKRH